MPNSEYLVRLRPFIPGMILLMLSVAAEARTGEIHGTVKGPAGPIVGATVRVLELDRAARSDGNGEFAFPNLPDGNYRVFVRGGGEASQTNSVEVLNNTAEAAFTLHESAVEMEEVVVSAAPSARTADEQYQSAESKAVVELHESPGLGFEIGRAH